MISNACTRSVIGSGAAATRSGERAQFALICGVSDDVIHVSMTSGSPANVVPPHFAHTLDRRRALERVDGQLLLGREHGFAALLAEPDRERHAVEALARDVPVVLEAFDPTVEAHLHVVGVPRELVAAREQLVVRDRARARTSAAASGTRPVVACARTPTPAARSSARRGTRRPLRGRRRSACARVSTSSPAYAPATSVSLPGRVDAEAEVEAVALPPLHVGAVAEGAHHHEAGAEVGAHVLVGEDRHLVAADRHDRG